MNDASSPAGQATPAAISAGLPRRPTAAAWSGERVRATASGPRHQAALPDQRYRPGSQRAMLR